MSDEIKRPDLVATVPSPWLYDLLCMDLEQQWLYTKNSVWLLLRLVDEPAAVIAGRDRKPFMAPDVADEMRREIQKSRPGSIWARDWRLMLLWAESLDEGLSLNKFAEEHADDGEDPRTLAATITRLHKRMKRLATALEERHRRFVAANPR